MYLQTKQLVDADAAHPRRDPRRDPRREVMYPPTCPEVADAAHPRRDQRREVMYPPTCPAERDAAHPRNPPREAQKNKQKRRE